LALTLAAAGSGTFQACIDDACANIPTGSKTYDLFDDIGDSCDTLYWTGQWPLAAVKVNWWSTIGADHKLALFSTDYCTGRPFIILDAASQEDDGWHGIDAGDYIKSVRPYNDAQMPAGQPGVGIKIVFFPNTGMMPYDQFTCTTDLPPACSQYNNWCDQGLVADSSPVGGPNGECASGDDRIFCIEPNGDGPAIITNGVPYDEGGGYMDFAGSTCKGSFRNDYLCSFQDYPIGSLWAGLYYINWNGGYCGSDFEGGNMGDFCNSADPKVVAARGQCLWMRFWKSDVNGPGEAKPAWDAYPFAQVVRSLADLCINGGGINFNICSPPAGQDLFGGSLDFQWCNSATDCSQYNTECEASWPMFTEFFSVNILDCPS
jgi:hypothetical protein